jgi:hypothetical protein
LLVTAQYKTPLMAKARNTVNGTLSFATAALLANRERNQLLSILLPIRTVATALNRRASSRYSYCMQFESPFQNPFSYASDFQCPTLFKDAHTAVPAPWVHAGVLVTAALPTVQTRYWIGDVPKRGTDFMEQQGSDEPRTRRVLSGVATDWQAGLYRSQRNCTPFRWKAAGCSETAALI